MYPDPDNDPWLGMQYDELLGVWMHPYRKFDTSYYSSGKIKSFNPSGEGWFDGTNFETIPTPGSLRRCSVRGWSVRSAGASGTENEYCSEGDHDPMAVPAFDRGDGLFLMVRRSRRGLRYRTRTSSGCRRRAWR